MIAEQPSFTIASLANLSRIDDTSKKRKQRIGRRFGVHPKTLFYDIFLADFSKLLETL